MVGGGTARHSARVDKQKGVDIYKRKGTKRPPAPTARTGKGAQKQGEVDGDRQTPKEQKEKEKNTHSTQRSGTPDTSTPTSLQHQPPRLCPPEQTRHRHAKIQRATSPPLHACCPPTRARRFRGWAATRVGLQPGQSRQRGGGGRALKRRGEGRRVRRGPQANGYLTRRPPSQADAVGAGASVVGESSVAGGVVVAPSAAPKELSAGPSPIASSSAASSLASGAVGEAAGEYSSSAIHGNVG